MSEVLAWPPEYRVRVNRRAKHIHLKIDSKGLVLVLPRQSALKDAVVFMNTKRDWIQKQLSLTQIKPANISLPNEIYLEAINRRFQVSYQKTCQHTYVRLLNKPGILSLYGNIDNSDLCVNALRDWLRKQAKKYLPEKLDQLSQHCQLPYRKVSIRSQETRWGSCNEHKDISLNDKLLFLPTNLLEYVIIHELCHTIELNHSAKFWRLVETHLPGSQQHRKQLHLHEKNMPEWV